ncbi:MAG: hypothetical protein E6Q97_01875 [Desulfurellales bacterium]|nr:MAG: hypothetical protein E6Q97_01875 [Desulfurellales bacterium]
MTPSRYQQAIFDAVADAIAKRRNNQSFRHIVVEAAAGSGKTHTLVETARRCPSAQFVVIAFGKRNADELAAKLPPNARASTAHSLGSRAWTETLGGRGWAPEVAVGGHSRPGKIARIVDAEVDKGRLPRWLRGKVERLVDLARMHGIVPGSISNSPGSALVNDVLPLCGLRDDTDDEWRMLMEHFDIYATGTTPEALIQSARTVLTTAIRYGHRIIDYTDMLYLPTLAQGSIWRLGGEVLCVDELQDLDHLQRQMVLHLIGTGCLFVGTGDSRQAIFGWRGADADSMQKICQATNAMRLPLSICYRCPTSHLDRARALAPAIEARPDAPAGLFEVYDEDGRCVESNVGTIGRQLSPTQFRPGDLVICRAKAPLVRAAYDLLKNNVPTRILGKDLGRGLLAYVDAVRAPNVTALLQKVESLTTKAIQRAADLDDDKAMEEAGDRRDVLVAVADSLAETDEWNNIDIYRERLLELFGDGEDRARVVTLSTIHRAKGAEADRVWWLDHTKPDLGITYKREAWRREAECLRFVALTRARQELRLIHSVG